MYSIAIQGIIHRHKSELFCSSQGHPITSIDGIQPGASIETKSSFCCYKDKSPLGIPPGIMQKMKVTKAAQTTEAEYAKDERDKKLCTLQKEICKRRFNSNYRLSSVTRKETPSIVL
jgi:hypothetical protein